MRRRALVAMVLLAGLAAGALVGCGRSGSAPTLRVGVAYDVGGLGNPLNTQVRKGVQDARHNLGKAVTVREFSAVTGETAEDRYDRLIILCQSGYDPVLAVGYSYAGPDPATGPLARAVKACPGTRFASVDDASVTGPTVANLVYADADGSYLVGEAAALTSRSGVVGFLGGCRIPQVMAAEAGYRAGVAAARPDAQVRTDYVVGDPASCGLGFATSELAEAAAGRLYAAGADVVYAWAGASGVGAFVAGKKVDGWGVGSVADQYQQVGPVLQSAVLTSMVKRVDRTVSGFVEGMADGRFVAGVHREGLREGSVGYSTSGGFVDGLRSRLDTDKQKIINGQITVPNGL